MTTTTYRAGSCRVRATTTTTSTTTTTTPPTTTPSTCGEGCVEREARTRHQDVLAVVCKSRDRDVQSTRATGTQDHVVGGDLVPKEKLNLR